MFNHWQYFVFSTTHNVLYHLIVIHSNSIARVLVAAYTHRACAMHTRRASAPGAPRALSRHRVRVFVFSARRAPRLEPCLAPALRLSVEGRALLRALLHQARVHGLPFAEAPRAREVLLRPLHVQRGRGVLEAAPQMTSANDSGRCGRLRLRGSKSCFRKRRGPRGRRAQHNAMLRAECALPPTGGARAGRGAGAPRTCAAAACPARRPLCAARPAAAPAAPFAAPRPAR